MGVGAILLLSTLAGVELAVAGSNTGRTTLGPTSPLVASSGPSCTITINHETPGNHAVQIAINAYGPLSSTTSPITLCIGPGNFPEQLTINDTVDFSLVGAGNTSTILAPSPVSGNGVDLKTGSGVAALIGAWNDDNLTIDELTLNGTHAGPALGLSCGTNFVGVYYGESSGGVNGSSVLGINTSSGCQGQNAVRSDNGYFTTHTVLDQTFNITNSTVLNYGKNGVSCIGLGLACQVNRDTVSTTPQGTGFAATNGVEFWDAAGSIQHNTVAGNVYLPGNVDGGRYFGPETTSSGDQYGVTTLSSPAEIWNNLISGTLLGVANDYSFSDAFGPVNALGTDFAGGNTIQNANVGMLGYDANVTYTGNTIGPSNVSIEDENDLNYVYTADILDDRGSANVSGALLGDVSSFQIGSSSVLPSGVFTVTGDTFTNTSPLAVSEVSFGTYVSGASATVENSNFDGFSQGLAVVVAGNAEVSGDAASSPVSVTGGGGIYVFADTASLSANTVSGYSFETGPGWWPDSQAFGIFLQAEGNAEVQSNSVLDSAIGIAVISSGYGPFPAPSWPYVEPVSAGPIDLSDNIVTNSQAFGIAFELNQQTTAEVATPTVTVESNTVDNTGTGAVGLMVDQGTYTITNNVFEGTNIGGSSGASQPTGEGPIATSSIQVLDASDSGTLAYIGSNSYLSTSVYVTVLNITTGPPYFASAIGMPALTAPAAPSVSATALDLDQPLAVVGAIPTTGVPTYSWAWMVSVNGGGSGLATQCGTDTGSGAAPGESVTCTIPASTLTAGDYYTFTLTVTDSATSNVTLTSPASATVNVASELTAPSAPTANRPALDVDQILTVSGTIPTTGTSPYAWVWWVSEDGNPSVPATQCAQNTGTGASGGSTVSCVISPNTLVAGHQYTFALGVTDSATSAESTLSTASNVVTVSSALGRATTPS
ncbi:MAG: hypothetical protein L3K02_04780, partial [Thermoplasmata archaeon]|nr:hypothetical protein [Thermoplasmata archaeon]